MIWFALTRFDAVGGARTGIVLNNGATEQQIFDLGKIAAALALPLSGQSLTDMLKNWDAHRDPRGR